MKVSGFSHKQDILVEKLLGVVANTSIDPEMFRFVHEELVRASSSSLSIYLSPHRCPISNPSPSPLSTIPITQTATNLLFTW